GRKPFGYRLDLDFGRTARLVNFNEGSRGDALEHLQQAYVSVNLTKSARTWLDFGKFVSPMGAEPIEATNNWLTSRGLLTTYATPYTLSGLRVTHQMKN